MEMPALFSRENFDSIVNLAAQAGVRYSLENPFAYVESNMTGFVNILEACRSHKIKKLVYASSSSVYGLNDKIPFSVKDNVDNPISLYAATKKSNELMAHAYSHLFGIKTIGLRFFTVYGPWGRPDMAMFLFTEAILNNKPIRVFNNGELSRDFTYIDDIIDGVMAVLLEEDNPEKPLYSLYNIGNSKPVKLLDFINEIEKCTGKTAIKEFLPMQPGDVEKTWADVTDLKKEFNYNPKTDIKVGVRKFIEWYKGYYKNGLDNCIKY
jgi:UDP-glucuronate 4-epimerase